MNQEQPENSEPLICHKCFPLKRNHPGPCVHALQIYNAGYQDCAKALKALYDAVDSCVELTPAVLLAARAALDNAKGV